MRRRELVERVLVERAARLAGLGAIVSDRNLFEVRARHIA